MYEEGGKKIRLRRIIIGIIVFVLSLPIYLVIYG